MIDKILDMISPVTGQIEGAYDKNWLFYAIIIGIILLMALSGYVVYNWLS